MAGKSADHREPTDVEEKCKLCGTACWLGTSQTELMELLGPDSFLIVGDCCLPTVAKWAESVDIQASDEIVERVKARVRDSDTEDSEG